MKEAYLCACLGVPPNAGGLAPRHCSLVGDGGGGGGWGCALDRVLSLLRARRKAQVVRKWVAQGWSLVVGCRTGSGSTTTDGARGGRRLVVAWLRDARAREQGSARAKRVQPRASFSWEKKRFYIDSHDMKRWPKNLKQLSEGYDVDLI